jgi:hypothetical protein
MDTNELFCAIRGPIAMITIGALFALDHLTPYGFDRTWPVLLIVFGLLSLVSRSMRRPSPPVERGAR